MATEVRRVCCRCGGTAEECRRFTPSIDRQRRRHFSRWCDDCRDRAWRHPRDGDEADEADDSFTVTARDAARFLALAAEYAARARAEDDPVLAHRLSRAASDYRTMAARCRG